MAVINTITGIYDASITGWKPFLWYYADWALFFTLATQWCLFIAHFFPFNAKFNNAVHTMYQVNLPMEVSITILYWKFFYTHGTMHLNDVNTYAHPVFLYIVPALFLMVEYFLNQIVFDYKKIINLMVLYVIYLPFTYIGKWFLGYFPYQFITWNTWYSYAVLIALAIMQIIFFFGLAFLSNYFKRKYLMKNLE